MCNGTFTVQLKQKVTDAELTMVDCEFASCFISNCHLHDVLEKEGQPTARMSSHTFSDDKPMTCIVDGQAAQAESPTSA